MRFGKAMGPIDFHSKGVGGKLLFYEKPYGLIRVHGREGGLGLFHPGKPAIALEHGQSLRFFVCVESVDEMKRNVVKPHCEANNPRKGLF